MWYIRNLKCLKRELNGKSATGSRKGCHGASVGNYGVLDDCKAKTGATEESVGEGR